MNTAEAENNITLALETAVAGGSIGLYAGCRALGSICGNDTVSRAEALMPNIRLLLEENEIDRSKINKVIVSTGPGSFTGIRIGIATALGLSSALRVEAVGVPLLPAMSYLANDSERCVCVVPISKTDIGFQFFERSGGERLSPDSDPEAAYLAELPDILNQEGIDCAVLYPSLIEAASYDEDPISNKIKIIDSGINLSGLIASREAVKLWGSGPEPIYLINPAKKQRYPV